MASKISSIGSLRSESVSLAPSPTSSAMSNFDVVSVFEIDENIVEAHLIEFLCLEHPFVVIIGIDGLVVDLLRIAVGDQPFVGTERNGQLSGAGGLDRTGNEHYLGIIQMLVAFQVENRPQHLDLHQRSPDAEWFRSVVHDVEKRSPSSRTPRRSPSNDSG